MRKFLIIIVLLLVGVLCISCQKADDASLIDQSIDESSEVDEAPQYTIGLVMKTLTNPFFVDMEKGARKAETECGIKLIVRTGAKETSIDQQIQIVEDFIVEQVDGIVIAPGSSTELIPVLKKAQDCGIKIVNIDNHLDAAACEEQGLVGVPFVSVKNDEGAYLSVKEITKAITEDTQALIFEGIEETENSELRVEGAKLAFSETTVRVVASQSANWKIDEAYILANDLFEAHPDVKLVFCANDMMALGVVQYLKEVNRQDVLVAGFDNLEDARVAIKAGWMKVTIDQQASEQGYIGVKTLVDLLNGIAVDNETYVPLKVVTYEDIE